MKKQLYLNKHVFFLLRNGEIILWDYKNHKQYEIPLKYFERLKAISQNPEVCVTDIEDEMFKAHILTDRKIDESWGWDSISEIFHIGTKDIPLNHSIANPALYTKEYIEFCEQDEQDISDLKTTKEGKLFPLPSINLKILKEESFISVLKNRITCRSFNEKMISLETLSTLLYLTFGQIHGEWQELEAHGLKRLGIRKSSPSAGGLHTSEAYVVVMNVENLPPGIYHYRSHEHVLIQISTDCKKEQLGRLVCGQYFVAEMGFGIFITARFEKLWNKYAHSRAYRVALFDIGHISQTFQLCATYLGLDPWLTAALLDTEINQLLKIEGTNEQVLFFVGAGNGNKEFLDKVTMQFLGVGPQCN